jgi:hypothetical protein
MWRRLLALTHPDRGGEPDLFIWCEMLRELVAGDAIEPPIYERPRRTTNADSPRLDFAAAHDVPNFDALTQRALDLAGTVPEPFNSVLWTLVGCYTVGEHAGPLYRQQWTGATYRSLAAIGHRVGMSKAERVQWYRICESIPLSQRHAGRILSRLQERAA